MQLYSPEYLEVLKAMHAREPWGTKGKCYFGKIAPFAAEIGAVSVLDYGCGCGSLGRKLREERPQLRVDDYDPAVEGREKFVLADLVTCTDVLEHIEGPYLGNVIDHAASLATRGLFFVIALKPDWRILPDGRNAHLIVEKPDWWRDRLRERLEKRWFVRFEKHKSLHIRATPR